MKRKILISAVSIMALIGVIFAVLPFLYSLLPSDRAVNDSTLRVDVSSLLPGELIEVPWRGKVFILRRTPEQIEWLRQYQPPELSNYFEKIDLEPTWAENKFRSLSPEFLVLWADGYSNRVYLREQAAYYSCDDFNYFTDVANVKGGKLFLGGFVCNSDGLALSRSIEQNDWVYDLAGRSVSSWIAPISVPDYSLSSRNEVVLGP